MTGKSFLEVVRSSADTVLSEKHGMTLTVKDGIVIPNAGIDTSNVPEGTVIPWPRDSFSTAKTIADYMKKAHTLTNFGVIICDSRITPQRRGVTGVALGWYGFNGITDYRGKTDLFGKPLKVTTSATADNLVSGALLLMGESNECTPIVIVKRAPVLWSNALPQKNDACIDASEDLFM